MSSVAGVVALCARAGALARALALGLAVGASAQTYHPPGSESASEAPLSTTVEVGEARPGIAQDMLPFRGEPSGVVVEWQAFAPSSRDNAYGFVDIWVKNGGPVQRQVFVSVRTPDWSDAALAAERQLVLEPGEARRLALPYPSAVQGRLELVLACDDADDEESARVTELDDPALPVAALVIRGAAEPSPLAVEVSGFDPLVHRCALDQLPATWTWLSGFDVVVVGDDLGPSFSAEAAALLRDYAAGGGAVVAMDWQRLPGGPLRELFGRAAAQPDRVARHGMGRVVASVPGAVEADFAGMLTEAARHPGATSLVGVEPIPGMESVPVKVFFVLVLCFAICVGPLNYWILRRRRRQTVLVVTVPAIGLLFTVGILLWGLFRDGFGVRGAVRTFTVFDQQEQQAASVGLRSLYAGVGPAQLELDPGTLLGSSQAYNRSNGYRRPLQTHALRLDADRLVVDGSALPSRFLTSLETTSVARSRPRIAFAPEGNGLRLRASREFAPADGSTVVARAPDGRYFSGTARGDEVRLDPVQASVLRGFARDAAERVTPDAPLFEPAPTGRRYGSRRREPAPERHSQGVRARIEGFERGIPPGSYLLWARRPPGWDDLGIEVEWLRETHLVFGLCGKEDFDG